MREIFADTGYWIAVIDPGDNLRVSAMTAAAALGPAKITTTNAVLIEVLNHFSGTTGRFRQFVASVVEGIHESVDIKVVRVSDHLFMSGLSLYSSYSDKNWSHVDCMSFEVMRHRNISEALAHDVHFRQAGFITLIE